MSLPSINMICNEAAEATTQANKKKKKEGKQNKKKTLDRRNNVSETEILASLCLLVVFFSP